MILCEEELGSLRLESTIEEIGAKLEDIFRLFAEDLAIQGIDFVLV